VRVTSSQKSGRAESTRRKAESASDASQSEQKRQAKIAIAKVSLQEAKSLLIEARARAQSLEAAQKKAQADVRKPRSTGGETEERFEKARLASEDAIRRARSIAAESKAAAKSVEDAKRTVEKHRRNSRNYLENRQQGEGKQQPVSNV
jgi:hypothetical protein